jgi:Na+-transporting NADH:ubiquinone oxidoreductase subunit F
MRFLRKLHKWLGLIVGIQVLFWAVSGLVFAWLDHHDVTAEHSTRPPQPAVFTPAVALAEPEAWHTGVAGKELLEVRLTSLLDRWVWRVETSDGVTLRSAETGEVLQLNEDLVRRLAQQQYAGAGRLVSTAFHPAATIETRGAGATWEARFDDEQGTTLYFAADDGRLVQKRNSTWRLFDFFWMLHTMDYKSRDNFNNPLVITIGMAALWLSLSGLILLLRSFRRHDFAFLEAGSQRAPTGNSGE